MLVLVTGAGASRQLGEPDEPLPLMRDWSNALWSALNEAESGLAEACLIAPGLNGEDFESALGLLLRYQQVHPLEQRFEGLGGPSPGAVFGGVREAREKVNQRLLLIAGVINQTLYDQFGQGRISDDRAAQAYKGLLGHLNAGEMVVATTNYDRAGEAALVKLGRTPDTGFRASPGRTPALEVHGLVRAREKGVIPYLHLHGSVGWYERNGTVYDHQGDQPYNQTLGTPVVLYPDPEKDPTHDAIVSELWAEFGEALTKADRVFVLGHSLHDPALVSAIRAAEPRKLAVTYFDDAEAERILKLLPTALRIKMDFGPDLDVEPDALAPFLS